MAILNKIRQQSLVLILVIALALFAFILSGLLDGSANFSGKSQDVIATINGKDIDRLNFVQKVTNVQQSRGMSTTQAVNAIWDQELATAVMDTEFDKLGLTVERDQMRSLLEQNLGSFEEFKNEAGLFDENKLNEYIANLKAISPETTFLGGRQINYNVWVNTYENGIASTGVRNNYFNMIKSSLAGTLTEGALDHKLANDKVDVKFVQIPYTSIPDSTITVTEKDVASYVNNNKSKYEVEKSRNISYVAFREVASLEDENTIKNNLVALEKDFIAAENNSDFLISNNSATAFEDSFLYKNQLGIISDSISKLKEGETYGPYRDNGMFKIAKVVANKQLPDSVKIRHILIPFRAGQGQDPATVKTEEQAQTTADSIYNILKRNRSKFKQLLELSSNLVPGKETNGEVELSYASRILGPAVSNFSFQNKKGTLEVVKTSYGFHVVEILEQKNIQKTSKIAYLSSKIEPSEKTIDSIFKATSKFEIAVNKQAFTDVAAQQNYIVRPVSAIKELDETIPGIGVNRSMVKWAFNEETKVGDIKRFTIPGGGFAIAKLTTKTQKGLMNIDKAAITANAEIRKQKKAELIKQRITAGTMEQIAAAENQTVKTALALNMKNATLTGAGSEPKVIGTAFGLNEGDTSQLITGNFGVYIVQVTKKTTATELPSYEPIANRLGETRANEATNALYEALKKMAEIEDNRADFY